MTKSTASDTPDGEKRHGRTKRHALDAHDRALLRLVQENNQRTHADLGEAVHLSPSSVRRRLARLRREGVIERDVSIVDPGTVGVTVIVMVTFQDEKIERIRAFRQRMIDAPEVAQCLHIAGSVDYMLVVHAPDLPAYEAWSERALMNDDTIRRYDSHIVWSRIKHTTAVPIAP